MFCKWCFGKKFIGNYGNVMEVNEVDRFGFRGRFGFYRVILKIFVVGKYSGSDRVKLVIIGGTSRKR